MSGWYPDPTGRFEYRYHNGHAWTADVAAAGQRFFDRPAVPARNTLAIAAMVCGIVAVSAAWIPFVVFGGLVLAVVAIALGGVALARSRRTGTGRGFAIAGLACGGGAIALGVLGIVLTAIVIRVLNEYEHPEPHNAALSECSASATGPIVATGSITNQGDEVQTYAVLVELQPRAERLGDRYERVVVDDVAPGATASFTARTSAVIPAAAGDGEPDCRIVAVNGPVPFGFDPELID